MSRLLRFVDLAHAGHVVRRAGHLRIAGLEVDVSFLDHSLNEVVQQCSDLLLKLLVALTLASQLLDHFRRELTTLDERLEQSVLERVRRVGVVRAGPTPVWMVVGTTREPTVHQEV